MTDKSETRALFAGAMVDAQELVTDRIHDAIEVAESRGYHRGEAKAWNALHAGVRDHVETLIAHYQQTGDTPFSDHVTRDQVDAAVATLTRHFAALAADRIGATKRRTCPECEGVKSSQTATNDRCGHCLGRGYVDRP